MSASDPHDAAAYVLIGMREGDRLWCELSAPQRLSLGKTVSVQSLARAVSLTPGDVVTRAHPPRVASVGLPFLVAELADRAALERARVNMDGLDALVAEGVTPDIHLYVHSADDFDLRARMFAPLDGEGAVVEIRIGGASVLVSEGFIEVDQQPRAIREG